MHAALEIIRLEDAVRQRWRNDGGWTREIARGGAGDDWTWRASVADVESDGPFSAFPGIEREIVLLSGAGMQFEFEDGSHFALTPESPRLRFPGEATLHSRLIDGPTRDFNLMWQRGRIAAELWLRPLVGSSVLFADPGETWLLHVVSGHAQLPDAQLDLDANAPSNVPMLQPGDTLLLRADEARIKQRMVASGSAIVAKLTELQRLPNQGFS